jgi:hypothetical protein
VCKSPGVVAGALRFSPSRYRVFGRLHRSGFDDFASWFRLKDGRLFCEWIDALAGLRGGLLYNDELGEHVVPCAGAAHRSVLVGPAALRRRPPRCEVLMAL